jgi:hypothetical protein
MILVSELSGESIADLVVGVVLSQVRALAKFVDCSRVRRGVL